MRVLCESCGAAQPPDWQAGDRCTACGGPARREQRCAWCARWTPAGRFCRACGTELVEPARWGAARMLKAGGVDKFQLAARLAELDADHAEHLQRLFEAQRAVVQRRVEEVRHCERALVAGGHADRLEEALLVGLPLDEAALAELGGGPAGASAAAEALEAIERDSPLPATRQLASLALLRRGSVERPRVREALALLLPGSALALEAALALSHWRLWALDLNEHLVAIAHAAVPGLDQPRARLWAAVANGRVERWLAGADAYTRDYVRRRSQGALERCCLEGLSPLLEEGLHAGDPDLRFCCALLLEREVEAEEAAEGGDEAKASVARRWLAARHALGAARLLATGSDPARLEIVSELREDRLTEAWREPLLAAVEGGGDRVRGRAAWKLAQLWDQGSVARAVAAVERTRDHEILKALFQVEGLPGAQAAVSRVFEANLQGPHRDALKRLAREGGVGAQAIRGLLESAPDPDRLLAALSLAEASLGAAAGQPLLDAVVRTLFGDHPRRVRVEACWVLTRVHRHARLPESAIGFSREQVRRVFGTEAAFLARLIATCQDLELLHEVGYYDWLAAQLKYAMDPTLGADDPAQQGRWLDALIDLSMKDVWLYLRTGAAELAGKIGAAPAHRERFGERMRGLAAADVPYDLRYWFERFSKELAGEEG